MPIWDVDNGSSMLADFRMQLVRRQLTFLRVCSALYTFKESISRVWWDHQFEIALHNGRQ
jgi:hypothetical protein